jgi:hypothetical protein
MLEPGIVSRMRRGALVGFSFATLMSGYVGLTVGLLGSQALQRYNLSLGQLVALYYCVGIPVGALSGALRPLASGLVGSIVVSFILWVPIAISGGLALGMASERYYLGGRLIPFSLVLSAVLAPIYGAISWYQDRE